MREEWMHWKKKNKTWEIVDKPKGKESSGLQMDSL